MTDELDALKAALKAATPAPLAESRTEALRLAMENFNRIQGSAGPARLPEDRPAEGAGFKGVWKMLKSLSHRPVLAGATSVAALFAVALIVTPLIQQGARLTLPSATPVAAQKPAVPPPGRMAAAALDGASPQQAVPEVDARSLVPPSSLAPPSNPAPKSKPAANVATALAPPAEDAAAAAVAAAVASADAPARDKLADATSAGAAADMGQVESEAAPLPAAPAVTGLAKGGAIALGAVVQNGVMAAAPADVLLAQPDPNTEAFANAAQNPVHVTAEEPVSTFSADVDTASYAVVRSSLNAGGLPPPEAVRIEEMVNYFPYAYPAPTGDQPFAAAISVMPTPWNPGTELVRIGLQGKLPAIADRPPLNLVFLIDTSGSMEDANKLPLLMQSLRLMLPKLRAEDRVAIVTYAGSAGEVLPPTPASDRAAIDAALDRLDAGGSTAGAEGIALA